MRNLQTCVAVAVLVGLVGWAFDASAVPGFARETKEACSSCHTTWSQLTNFGRDFKESGYDAADEKISEDLAWYQNIPISGRMNMRLIDWRHSKTKTTPVTDKDKRLKIRAFHEFEVFFAGSFGEDFSFFAELEGEDEIVNNDNDQRGFDIWIAHGIVGYHNRPEFNVYAGWSSPFFADPYNTLNARKTNRYGRVVDGFLPGTGQFLSVSGRYDKVFYMGSWHDHPNKGLDIEGEDPFDLSFRAAVDVLAETETTPQVSVGGFYTRTKATHFDAVTEAKLDGFSWNTFGGDAQVDYKSAHLNLIFVVAEDSLDLTMDGIGDDTSRDWVGTAEAHYFYMPGDRPLAGPSVIFENFTKNDELEHWSRLGVFATAFPKENIKVQVGWEGDVHAPTQYVEKEGRITVVFDAAF
ncbi:MAG: hypothetical protein ACE5EO_08360 [Candidatus Krumholzibacteriia bacterium]